MTSQPILAVDPARYGPDSTVCAVRRAMRLEALHKWRGASTTETVIRVREIATEAGVRGEKDPGGAWGLIVVDEVGLGAGVLDQLRAEGLRCRAFNGGQRAKEPQRFLNMRAEAFWNLRRLLEEGQIELPADEELFTELLAISWFPTSDGKVAIERKQDMKGRLGRSPDKADALVMAFSDMGAEPPRFFGAGSTVYDLKTMTTHELGRPKPKENIKMKRNRRNEIAAALSGIGRAFQIAGTRIERELIVKGVAAVYRADRRLRYAGPSWVGYECGFRLDLPGVGVLCIAPEACLLDEDGGPTAEITVHASMDRDEDAIRESMAFGALSRPELDRRGPKALWNARGLVHTDPAPVRAIILDLGASVVGTDPPGVEVRLHAPGPDELPCSEDEMTELLQSLLFRSLEIREQTHETTPTA